jgi:hypothetical protein
VRREHRVRVSPANRPDTLPTPGETTDMSEGGVRILAAEFPEGVQHVNLDIQSEFSRVDALPGRLVARFDHGDHVELRVEFSGLSMEQERSVIELMFTDPDAWTHRPITQHPLQSLLTVIYAPWRALVLSLRDDEMENPPA